jgi:hypothetical protein
MINSQAAYCSPDPRARATNVPRLAASDHLPRVFGMLYFWKSMQFDILMLQGILLHALLRVKHAQTVHAFNTVRQHVSSISAATPALLSAD